MGDWLKELKPSDWLFDGSHVRGEVMLARFAALDWSKAWVDMGPSIFGNPGPYWHVPLGPTVINGERYGDTTHRLYPKLLQTKWLGLVRQACEEMKAKCATETLQAQNRELHIQLATANIKIAELQRRVRDIP